jgi:hypothetical protein
MVLAIPTYVWFWPTLISVDTADLAPRLKCGEDKWKKEWLQW